MKIKKNIILGLLSFFLFVLFSFSFALANENDSDSINNSGGGTTPSAMNSQVSAFNQKAGFSGTATVEKTIATVIKVLLSMLGILFVGLMIFSGFQWMTAGGNEDMVKKAKTRIVNALIGLLIVVLAYAITAFVFRNLPGGGGQTTSGVLGETQN